MSHEKLIQRIVQMAISCLCLVLVVLAFSMAIILKPDLFIRAAEPAKTTEVKTAPKLWSPPDSTSIPNDSEGATIRYGRELVSHTSIYLGPKGKVKSITNGMNCQNCHLNAGTKFFGNNYSAVASTYPKFRVRSGTVESIEKRVNDCLERSLNGKPLDNNSPEMKAFVTYIKWVGQGVPKDSIPKGSGLATLPFLKRAADAENGKVVFRIYCTRCHGASGKGIMADSGLEWKYPPLFGDSSYNIGAGLYRLTRMAGFVKMNMPNDIAAFDKPLLTDEEAWDVAAFINSLPRPSKDISNDWPDILKKPIDHPFGPYADRFSEVQHKYGPFASMKKK